MDTIADVERVNSTRLRRDTADLLNRVAYGGVRIIITSSGKERAALVSVEDLERLLALPQSKVEEMVGGWLDQHFEGAAWERVYLALVGVGGLLEQLGLTFTPPTRWVEDIS